MDPEDIGRRLLAIARHLDPPLIDVVGPMMAGEDREIWRREFGPDNRLGGHLWEVMGTLQQALEDAGWDPDVSDIPQAERDRWTFGEAFTLRGAPREIVRGFLQPLRVEPVLWRVSDSVALYLISIVTAKTS
jgi:hypothetical protein